MMELLKAARRKAFSSKHKHDMESVGMMLTHCFIAGTKGA